MTAPVGTTTVGSATTVRPASTMEAAAVTTVERLSPVESAAVTAAETLSAMEAATVVKSAVTVEPFTATEPVTVPAAVTAETLAAAESVAAVEPMPPAIIAAAAPAVEPRTGADKHAAVKIVRTVVSVRSAGIRRIAVIAVSTIRRRRVVHRSAVPVAAVDRPDPDSNSHLRAGRTGHARPCHQNPQHQSIF